MVWKKACRIHSECHRSMPAASIPVQPLSPPLVTPVSLTSDPSPLWGTVSGAGCRAQLSSAFPAPLARAPSLDSLC